ncbi:hypothetical protein GCM10027422_07300 [Hymenobacter arcticus]
MQLVIFEYEDNLEREDLTTIDIDGEVWFIALEVCKVLDIQNVSDAVSRLDEDEKQVTMLPRSGQLRATNIISESGLYNLILRSNKPGAKAFRRWLTKVVLPAIRKRGGYGTTKTPTHNFVLRYNANWNRTSPGYFSVISELFVRLYGKFEMVGYEIPTKALTGKEIRPDVSVGKLFSTYLTKFHEEEAANYTKYPHLFPDGSEYLCRQYPNSLLPTFIDYVENEWIPKCAANYLKDKDPKALEYLPLLLGPKG